MLELTLIQEQRLLFVKQAFIHADKQEEFYNLIPADRCDTLDELLLLSDDIKLLIGVHKNGLRWAVVAFRSDGAFISHPAVSRSSSGRSRTQMIQMLYTVLIEGYV